MTIELTTTKRPGTHLELVPTKRWYGLDVRRCQAVTGSGWQCQHAAKDSTPYCGTHMKMSVR